MTDIINFAVERFSEISTIGLHLYFIYRVLDVKVGIKAQIIAGVAFGLVRMVYFMVGFPYRPYFAVIAGMFYSGMIFYAALRIHIMWTVTLVVLDGIVDAALISIYLLFPGTTADQISYPGISRNLYIIISKLILLLVYHFVTRNIEKSFPIDRINTVYLLIFPIGCWTMLEVIFTYVDVLPSEIASLLAAASSLVLLLMIVSVIALYNRITSSSKALTQSKMRIKIAEMTSDHIKQIKNVYNELSALRHDLQNHLMVISGYIKQGDYILAENYIHELNGINLHNQAYVQNPIVNTLIATKKQIAENHNIEFSFDVTLPKHIPLDDIDLCIIISNILDNAYEASVKSGDRQFINFKSQIVDAYWVITCRNSTKNRKDFMQNESLRSTKSSGDQHGIGTKQIQLIAGQNGGFVTYQQRNNEFMVVVMIELI